MRLWARGLTRLISNFAQKTMFTFRSLLRLTTARHKNTTPTFTEFITKSLAAIPELKGYRRPATIKNYRTAIVSLQCFARKTAIHNQPLSCDMMQQYEAWLKLHGISPNTSSCYVRSLRSLYNTLFPHGDKEIFHNIFTGNMRTMKRALAPETVKKVIACQPPRTSPLRLWHDVFLFSVYALGMPFIDVAYLRWSDVSDGFISYRRHKTGQKISVPLTSEINKIMDSYRSLTSDDLVFPILHSYDCPYHIYQHRLTQYNSALKRIRLSASIAPNLTSYVARHTWASLANSAGVSLSHISQAMGHADISTTQIYLSHVSSEEMMADSLAVTRLIND